MNDLEHQLGDLLEQAAGQPPRQIDAHGVRRSARRQTRAIAGVSSALAVVLALAVALPLSLAGNDGPAAEDVVAPPSPDRSVLPVDPTTYTLNAELFWSAKSGLTGCYVIALSAPPTGCSGIPVSTDMAPTALPTAERLSTGDVLTGPLHLVGHWDGHALVLSEKPSPTGQVTNGIAPDCPPPVSDAAVTTLTERVSGDDADLRSRGIAIISMGQCGGDVLIQVAAATPATVAYLMATYKDVIVYGWLVPLTGEPTPTETPNVAPIPASTPVVVPAGAPFTVLSRTDVGGAPVRLLQADGALFAMICCAENSGRASSIVRIDQATERVTATAHPGDAKGIAFDAGYLWAVDDGVAGHPVVAALDPTTLKTIRTVALPESGADLAVAGGYLWVAGRNALYRVDPGSGSLASSVPVDNADAADGGIPLIGGIGRRHGAVDDRGQLGWWRPRCRPGAGPAQRARAGFDGTWPGQCLWCSDCGLRRSRLDRSPDGDAWGLRPSRR